MKKVISAVAAITLLSTGAFAFESLTDGTIVTKKDGSITGGWFPSSTDTIKSGYTGGKPATSALLKSKSKRGDALIYPALSQTLAETGWSTEMVVRNTTELATVAKVVLYSADTTREILDFNIYLSPNDVFRFEIKNGKVTTSDDSIVKFINYPNNTDLTASPVNDGSDTKSKNIEMNKMGEKWTIGELKETLGYVTIYGMANVEDATNKNFHKKHAELAQKYRLALDERRPNWRKAYAKAASTASYFNFVNGMMTDNISVPSPNVAEVEVGTSKFKDVTKNSLTGTVRISRDDNAGNDTDMILPATALENYTDGNIVLWSEGEYAAIQDRTINNGKYVKADILRDAVDFVITNGIYTYKAGTTNQLLFTQPFKRILGQLNDSTYYTLKSQDPDVKGMYGGFKTNNIVYNESEDTFTPDNTGTPNVATTITSPYTGDKATRTPTVYFENELQVLSNKEDLENSPAYNKFYKGQNGFAYIYLDKSELSTSNVNNANGIPAIVTQYIGSTINGAKQTNWIYAPFTKKLP